jgi:hypothetical protein
MKYFKQNIFTFLLWMIFCQILFFTRFFACCSASSLSGSLISCTAATSLPDSHNDVDHAKVIHRNTEYETSILSNGFHYYCLMSQESTQDMMIRISSQKGFSFSFQLFDQTGTFCAPSTYSLDPVNHVLQICYSMEAQKSYLFALQNTGNNTSTYTIHYKQKTTNTTKKSKKTKKSKTTSKPKVTVNPKVTVKPNTKNSVAVKPTSSARPVTTTIPVSTGKPKKKNTKKQKTVSKPTKQKTDITYSSFKLSRTFIQLKKGETFSLKASMSSLKDTAFEWSCSKGTLLKNKKRTAVSFSATAAKKGTLIITCKQKGNSRITASCTIKIT